MTKYKYNQLFEEILQETEEIKSQRIQKLNTKSHNIKIKKINELKKNLIDLKNNKEKILTTKKVEEVVLPETITNKNTNTNNNKKIKKNNIQINMLKPRKPQNNKENEIIAPKMNSDFFANVIIENANTKLKNTFISFFKFNLSRAKSQFIYYFFKKTNKKLLKNISSIIENSFLNMSSIISRPSYYISNSTVNIHLFLFIIYRYKYLYKGHFLDFNSKKLKLLSLNLSKLLHKNVVFDLNRLKNPYFDSDILAKYFSKICDIRKLSLYSKIEKILKKTSIINPKHFMPDYNEIIPTFLTGIKIRVAGRLNTKFDIPKNTVTTRQIGSLTRNSADFVSKSRFTVKSKKGIYCVTTYIGNRFYR